MQGLAGGITGDDQDTQHGHTVRQTQQFGFTRFGQPGRHTLDHVVEANRLLRFEVFAGTLAQRLVDPQHSASTRPAGKYDGPNSSSAN